MNGRNLILFLFCIIFMFPLYCAAKAHRIVSLSPAMTELICVLGAEKELVGRSSVCDYPATIRTVPVAGDFANPNLEKILALMPDIVVTNDLINPSVEKVLRARKIQV